MRATDKPYDRQVCLMEPSEARVSRSVLREAGGEIPPAYSPAHLREEAEQWTVHGAAADDTQEVADEAE